jgi:aldose 1-epimerase
VSKLKIYQEEFALLPDGRQASLYNLENKNGMQVQISDYGGVVRRIMVPDRNGKFDDVVLGYKTNEEYISNPHYFGALIGRSANLLNGNIIEIDGKMYELDKNDGENNLHGGVNSLTYRLLDAEAKLRNDEPSLILTHVIEHLSDGFPGNLEVSVIYTLKNNNSLRIDYCAVSDADTVISFTNHTHFNLGGHASKTIYDHVLRINADFYTPIDLCCIPTGEILSVKDTPFDFRKGELIGDKINTECEQLNIYGGYDHNFVIKRNGFREALTLTHPASGRELTVLTDLPGVHLYTCNILPDDVYKDNEKYEKHQGMCFETQMFPNAVEMPWVLSPIRRAGEKYTTTTEFNFGVANK